MKPFKKAVIVGVGLIGGSLGLALRKQRLAKQVVGLVRKPRRSRALLRLGVVDQVTADLRLACAGADLLIVATPWEAFDRLLPRLAKAAPAGALLSEVASVKGASVARWHRLAGPLRFVAAHPMAGSEKGGAEHADAKLFAGRPCILTPTAQTDPRALRQVMALWAALGSRVHLLAPAEHDQLVAALSHLPHAAAFALTAAVAKATRPAVYSLAGAGYFDSTRVAASDPALWAGIFAHHPALLRRLLRDLRGQLLAIEKAAADPARLTKLLSRASSARRAAGTRRAA